MNTVAKRLFTSALLAVLLAPAMSTAGTFNITVPDGTPNPPTSGWHGQTAEDNETEPGTVAAQKWDLEALVYDNADQSLTIVGGFNFQAGESGGGHTFNMGDIFIDIDGDASPGGASSSGYSHQKNTFGYDYVISFNDRDFSVPNDFGSLTDPPTFDVYALTSDSDLVSVYFDQLSFSNPWIYDQEGHPSGVYDPNTPNPDDDPLFSPESTATQVKYDTDAAVNAAFGGADGWDSLQGYDGDQTHYALTLDIGWLIDLTGGDDDIHMAIGCGNDMIAGSLSMTSVPDGGTTAGLLAVGFLGLAIGVRRRQAA